MRIALALAAALLLAPMPVSAAAPAPGAPAQAAPSGSAKAAELDSLFAALKSVSDESDARVVESRIQDLWLDSGDVEVNRLMGTPSPRSTPAPIRWRSAISIPSC